MGVSEICFSMTAAATVALFYFGVGRESRVLLGLLLWATLVSGLAAAGIFEDTNTLPPRLPLLLLPTAALSIWLYRYSAKQPLHLTLLAAVSIVRLPVELVLYALHERGDIPISMTYAGWNYDILMGVTAVGITVYLARVGDAYRVWLLRVWHYLGIAMLTVIVVTAILSTPSPLQQLAFEQPNRALLYFPYTLLGALVVPLVYLSHFLSLRKLATPTP